MINGGRMSSNRLAYDSIADLCQNHDELQESELISQLQSILKVNPNAVHQKNHIDWTLLHHAARRRSPEFCQLLVSLNKDLVRTADNRGMLPFHLSCLLANTNTAKYLYRLHPESIITPGSSGFTPLNMVLIKQSKVNKMKVVKFLLDNDQGAVSTPYEDEQLSLHIATEWSDLPNLKIVFNAYPEALHTIDNQGRTSLDVARHCNRASMVDFFEQQIELESQARSDKTPDNDGQLPIHRALRNGDASLGGIKLMLAANQASTSVEDNGGHTPLHIACHAGKLDAAKFLMGVNQGSLQTTDTRGNLPLHLACAGGNCEVVLCILEQSTYGVTLQNSNKQTPIELLLFESECDRDSMDYVEAVRYLFEVNPDDTLKCLVKKEDGKTIDDKQGAGIERKIVPTLLASGLQMLI